MSDHERAVSRRSLVGGAGRKAVPLPGDLRDAAFCRRLVDAAVRQLGGRAMSGRGPMG